MPLTDLMLAEYTHEAAQTRRILERVPAEQRDWKPHDKSMSLGRLAMHVADLASWTPMTLTSTELDVAKGYRQDDFTTTDALLAVFDRNVGNGQQALSDATDQDLDVTWTFRSGDHVIFAMPRGQCMRTMALNHTVHHRGQLSVYLRLLGVPVPGLYGPSADEQ